MVHRRFTCFALLWASLIPLSGCGGGGENPESTQTFRAQIAWPDRSKAIDAPASALSAVITVQEAGPNGGDLSWTANRTDAALAHSQTYFSSVKGRIGWHTINVRFYSQSNGAGDEVAYASFVEQIGTDGVIDSAVTVGNHVRTVIVAPDQAVSMPNSRTLTATAYDIDSHVLALSEGSFQWAVTQGGDTLRIEAGVAQGLKEGSATVTATADGVTSAPATVRVNTLGSLVRLNNLRGGSDGRPFVQGVSGDGNYVVGSAFLNSGGVYGDVPFRWSVDGGYQELEIGLTTPNTGRATRANASGSAIVGFTPGDITVGWIWRNGTVTWARPLLYSDYTVLTDVSDNGTVAVGTVKTHNGNRAIRWLKNDSYQLAYEGTDTLESVGVGISADGQTIVGYRRQVDTPDTYEAFLMVGTGSPTLIPMGTATSLIPSAISADGMVVVGTATVDGASQGFRWSQADGLTLLANFEAASSVSADGSVVGGHQDGVPMIWRSGASQTLAAFALAKYGLTLSSDVRGPALVSDAGTVVAGGLAPDGQNTEKPWILGPSVTP